MTPRGESSVRTENMQEQALESRRMQLLIAIATGPSGMDRRNTSDHSPTSCRAHYRGSTT
jgi:hypothetical protein